MDVPLRVAEVAAVSYVQEGLFYSAGIVLCNHSDFDFVLDIDSNFLFLFTWVPLVSASDFVTIISVKSVVVSVKMLLLK